MTKFCLTVACSTTRGIVAAVSTYLASKGCNITDSSQFDDSLTGQFFMRVSFNSEDEVGHDELTAGMADVAAEFGMDYSFHDPSKKMKVVVMVSRFGHCLNDILYRVRIDLIVLARYMQILSDDMCQKMSGRIINIHHSFLPSFKGANPYKQAYERGVKLIGATSHYVTADLDEGPIIEQDIVRVTHAQSASDYVAIHAHANHRVFLNGNKTVVFPASPSEHASERMG